MKKKVFTSIALICALLLLILQLCACSCIQNDGEQSGDSTPSATDPQQSDASQQPDGSQQPANTASISPDVIPSQGDAKNTPEPGTSGEPSGTDQPSPTATPSGQQPEGSQPAVTSSPGTTEGQSATPAPGTTPGPSQQPNVTPEPTQIPDVVVDLTWFDDSAPVYCDLDFDGKPERIELDLISTGAYSYSCILKVTIGASGKEVINSFAAEYFTKAFINNFNSGDGRVEIVICAGRGNRGQVTRAYRLNSDSSDLISINIPGWVETVSGNSMEMGRYIDVLGTWACSASFSFSRSEFAFAQQGNEWQIHRDSDRWCTVSRDFLVELYVNNSMENHAGFLYPGDKIYPTATDLSSYIRFTSDIGDNGSITITRASNGSLLINNQSVDNWFGDLQYID